MIYILILPKKERWKQWGSSLTWVIIIRHFSFFKHIKKQITFTSLGTYF